MKFSLYKVELSIHNNALINMNHSRIIFLDYMRVIAFTLVVIGHQFNNELRKMAADVSTHTTLRTLYSIMADASAGGAMGVVIFFLVSGYIITYVLQNERPLEFYLKRIFRIYPLYIFAVFCEIALQLYNGIPTPPLTVIIPRLLLIGDFFDTPLALGEVEWTLRVEILFYLFMGVLRGINITNKGNVLIGIFVITTFVLFEMPPFPLSINFHNAYLTIYIPFLFIGAAIFCLEKNVANPLFAVISILSMFCMHLILIERYSPAWGRFNYAFIGTAIFLSSWLLRKYFVQTKWCSFFAELTYAIYLFHKWIWDFLSLTVKKLDFSLLNSNVQIIVLLITICTISNRLIEVRGVRVGKYLTSRLFKKSA